MNILNKYIMREYHLKQKASLENRISVIFIFDEFSKKIKPNSI